MKGAGFQEGTISELRAKYSQKSTETGKDRIFIKSSRSVKRVGMFLGSQDLDPVFLTIIILGNYLLQLCRTAASIEDNMQGPLAGGEVGFWVYV